MRAGSTRGPALGASLHDSVATFSRFCARAGDAAKDSAVTVAANAIAMILLLLTGYP